MANPSYSANVKALQELEREILSRHMNKKSNTKNWSKLLSSDEFDDLRRRKRSDGFFRSKRQGEEEVEEEVEPVELVFPTLGDDFKDTEFTEGMDDISSCDVRFPFKG